MEKPITQYNKLSKLFHWLSALFILGLFALGLWMVDLSYYSQWYKPAPHWHKSIGLCLFVLTLLRLIWKTVTASPQIEGQKWEKSAAKSVHHLLYFVLFIIFISGYLISTADGRSIDIFNWLALPGFGSFIENQEDTAGEVYFYAALFLISLTALHLLAALKHHFINKDNTLRKML